MTLILNGSLDWHRKIEVLPKMKKKTIVISNPFMSSNYIGKRGFLKMNEMDSKEKSLRFITT